MSGKNVSRCIALLLFVLGFFVAHGQQKAINISIKDNTGLQYILNEYYFKNDSLYIRGDSDYGRSKIDYLQRKLERSEIKKIKSFLKTFPLDSLEDTYFNEFNTMQYISPDHFPRVIEVEISYNGKNYKSKMTNCYVHKIANLCNFLNEFIPPEVRIKLRKEDFDATIK